MGSANSHTGVKETFSREEIAGMLKVLLDRLYGQRMLGKVMRHGAFQASLENERHGVPLWHGIDADAVHAALGAHLDGLDLLETRINNLWEILDDGREYVSDGFSLAEYLRGFEDYRPFKKELTA